MRDVLDGNIIEGAVRIIWSPSSLKMIKLLKANLTKKCEAESNKDLKTVYNFIIDNFERAPFALREMEVNMKTNFELLQHRELKRTFQMFITRLKKFNELLELKKQDQLKSKSEEKQRLSKRRNEIELEHFSVTFEKKLKFC